MKIGDLRTVEGTREAVAFVESNLDADGMTAVGYDSKLDPWGYHIDNDCIRFGIAAYFHMLIKVEHGGLQYRMGG